jgi:Trk K+ transport system NAD-binding subunit
MGESKYMIVVGAGKVGWNLARELLDKGNEVTLIEKDRNRYLTVEQELEHNVQYGDASELWILERAVPEYGLVHLLDLPEERLEIIEMQLSDASTASGKRVSELDLPDGSLLISVLRGGEGFVPGPDTVLEPGDEVLAILDPGLEEDLKAFFGSDGQASAA